MFLMIEPSEIATKKSFKIFHEFYLTSGLKLNYDKTNIVCLGNQGSPPGTICEELQIKCVTSFTLLSIKLDTNLKIIPDINYNSKIVNIECLLKAYKQIKLSLIGKITVLKTLAVAKLVYLLKVLPSPSQDLVKKLKKISELLFGTTENQG